MFIVSSEKEGVLSLLSAIVLSISTWLWLAPHIFVSFWNWFITPLGTPSIGHWHALGLMTMFYLMTYHYTFYVVVNNNKLNQFGKAIGVTIGLLIIWVIGYLCS